jgi:hypothetical protein
LSHENHYPFAMCIVSNVTKFRVTKCHKCSQKQNIIWNSFRYLAIN